MPNAKRNFRIPTVFSPIYEAKTPTQSMRKLPLVAEAAQKEHLAQIIEPDYDRTYAALGRLHGFDYVNEFMTGSGRCAMNGWTWTEQIRNGVMAINSGQITAAKRALSAGISANVAQGFHHAGPWGGGGFCTFNGLALVAQEFAGLNVFVIDCDNHGGNGTAAFAEYMPNLFNYSVCGCEFGVKEHQRSKIQVVHSCAKSKKQWQKYTDALHDAFDKACDFNADLVIYQAGADCHHQDPLGAAGLSTKQMAERDLMVFEWCQDMAIPCMFVLAGGYNKNSKLLCELHVQTFRAAQDVWNKYFWSKY